MKYTNTILTTLVTLFSLTNSFAADEQRSLYESDMQIFKTTPLSGAADINKNYNDVFTKVFGGTDPKNLISFLEDRIAMVITKQESLKDIEEFETYTGFYPLYDWKGFVNKRQVQRILNLGNNDGMVAKNVSILFWLVGKLSNKTYTIYSGPGEIPIENPRDGVVILGDDYKESIYAKNLKKEIRMPVGYRTSTMLHEARHSDCSGGLNRQTLNKLKSIKSSYPSQDTQMNLETFTTVIANNSHCGQLHTACAPDAGSLYKGKQICDSHLYGPVMLQSLYVKAIIDTKKGDELNIYRQILAHNANLVPQNLEEASKHHPDMTSSSD